MVCRRIETDTTQSACMCAWKPLAFVDGISSGLVFKTLSRHEERRNLSDSFGGYIDVGTAGYFRITIPAVIRKATIGATNSLSTCQQRKGKRSRLPARFLFLAPRRNEVEKACFGCGEVLRDWGADFKEGNGDEANLWANPKHLRILRLQTLRRMRTNQWNPARPGYSMV